MQPGSQKEMQIDFDDDESPQQTEQGHPMPQNAVKQSRAQVCLIHVSRQLPLPCLHYVSMSM